MHIHTFNHTDYVTSHMPTLYVKVHGAEGLRPWAFVKKISELNIKSQVLGEKWLSFLLHRNHCFPGPTLD